MNDRIEQEGGFAQENSGGQPHIPMSEPDAAEETQTGDVREQERGNNAVYGMPGVRAEFKRPIENEATVRMREHFSYYGMISAVYALFYTFCLYKNASGITYPFFVAGTLVYFYLCMKKSGVPLKKGSAFFCISLVLLGISVFLTDNQAINSFTKTGIFLLTVSLMLHQFYGDESWSFAKYITAICQSILDTIGCLGRPFQDCSIYLKQKDKQEKKKGKVRYILLGLVITLPLLIIIIALLVSADAVFRELIRRILERIKLWDIILVILMTFAIWTLGYSFISMLYKKTIHDKEETHRNLEPVLAITVTSILAAVYVVFSVIQIVYLFFGKMSLPDGYNYSSYAREGFFQLLAVCLFNLVLVLLCMAFFRENKALKVILTLISLCTYIMVASSAYRMLVYIKFCHLTFLRILVLWALGVIAVILAGIIYTIFRSHFPLFHFCVVTVTVFYIVLAFAKPDYWIARYNMSFADRTGAFDVMDDSEWLEEAVRPYNDYMYLLRLSADAAPVLTSKENYIFLDQNTDWMNFYCTKMERKAENMGIRTFNLSRYLAANAVEKYR